jgi:hypothetical protein
MDPMIRPRWASPEMRLCGGCGAEWYSEVHLSDEAADCQVCGSPLLGVSRPASEIDLVFGPFVWRADDPFAT